MKKATLVSASPASPHFAHDCDICTFLGRLNGEDLYYCEVHDEYVRRFGDSPSENGSANADLVWGGYLPGTPYAFASLVCAREIPPREWTAEEANPKTL